MQEATEQRWWSAEHPVWRALLVSCTALTVIPLWSAKYLPFTDLPEHVAAMAAIRHWFDPAWKMQESFTLDLWHTSYSLYYLAGAAISVVVGSADRANLILLSLIAIGFPYSLRALLRALGRDERLALFGCTLFWNQSLLIGFFNYIAALPVLLLALALAVRQLDQPTRPREIALAALGVVLFYLHLSAVLFFVPAVLLAALHTLGGRRWRELPRQLLYLAPLAALGAFWALTSSIAHPARVGWAEPREIVFEPLDQGLAHVPSVLDIWHGPIDEWCLFGLIAAAAWMAWPSARAPESDRSVRARSIGGAWLLLAALCYFAIPQKLGWLWQLNERYAVIAALLTPLLLTPPSGKRGGFALVLTGAIAIIAASNATLNIIRFQHEVGPFDDVIAQTAPGKRMLVLVFEQRSAFARFAPFLHFGALYRARKGGVVAPSFADLPQSPLRYRPESAPPAQPYGAEWEPWRFRNSAEHGYYDYILVRGPDPSFAMSSPDAPEWICVARKERWALFARP